MTRAIYLSKKVVKLLELDEKDEIVPALVDKKTGIITYQVVKGGKQNVIRKRFADLDKTAERTQPKNESDVRETSSEQLAKLIKR